PQNEIFRFYCEKSLFIVLGVTCFLRLMGYRHQPKITQRSNTGPKAMPLLLHDEIVEYINHSLFYRTCSNCPADSIENM
ncbi:hypothetical protein, partial [Bacillus paramobilis]|uniref:hypothetical protein n=1 Tax=Bacillus paramobilis TaxID=2817477 RepID=UPI001BB3FA0A